MTIHRRELLALLGVSAGAPAAAQGQAYSGPVAFRHGVASGDPLQDRVVLWTRITPLETSGGTVDYRWRIDPVGGGRGRSGSGRTGPGRDYTVKVDATGLQPGRDYRFRFEAAGAASPEGRTRTLPDGPTENVVLAVASCSLFPNGYFNAYQAIADAPRVDAVLHLGDYIYEYGGPGSYGMDSPLAAQRPHDPDREIVSLDDYRRRHAQYKSDPQLQAAHARAPWIVAWDDHESANDSYTAGAENHQPEDGDWATRKAAALKAYFEWMPIRDPAPGRAVDAAWRAFRFGDVANLVMVETRLAARDKPLNYLADLPPTAGEAEVAAFKARLADPQRRLMSDEQLDWIAAEAARPGPVWQVLGNQVLMARIYPPDMVQMIGEGKIEELGKASPGVRSRALRMSRLARMGLPYGLDMWDGYPAARERLLQRLSAARANTVVLTGDSHAFWANEVHDEAGRRAAVEFGTTSITSPGGGDAVKEIPVAQLFEAANKEVLFTDQTAKGYTLLTLTREAAVAEFVAVSTIHDRAFDTRVVKRYRATPGPEGVSGLSEA
ncbi:alkaline phosphatase D family protein [Phenylobacterium sp.]|uniref:alkaline phosphatase D family protein n=1 Tax=Phenylobacterium sp. TaxID=1871053 RepID=UPI002E3188E6|nr:alkaline phosphatase D family protein [Phenylobacterium sp.]HEX2560385.1 alkaline phosphatase D family protein [Phenylobacterium sp.]